MDWVDYIEQVVQQVPPAEVADSERLLLVTLQEVLQAYRNEELERFVKYVN